MARYICSVTVAVDLAKLYPNITEILESCNLEVLIFREDYVMAREKTGQVPFTKLVTVEVLVDSTRSTMHAADFELVVKNDELPLQSNNHCSQAYQDILKKSAANSGWRLLSCSDQDFPVNVPAPAPQQASSSVPPAPPAPANSPPLTAEPASTPPTPAPPPISAAQLQPPAQATNSLPPSSDPSRFTSLPKVASRTTPVPSTADAADVKAKADTNGNGGTPQPSTTNGAQLTWQPMSSSTAQAKTPKLELDSSTSFEEFLAAGKTAKPTAQEQTSHEGST